MADHCPHIARNANQMCTTERKLASNRIVHLDPSGLPYFRGVIEERGCTLKVIGKSRLSLIGESIGSDPDKDQSVTLEPFRRKDLEDGRACQRPKKTRTGRLLRLTLPFAKVWYPAGRVREPLRNLHRNEPAAMSKLYGLRPTTSEECDQSVGCLD